MRAADLDAILLDAGNTLVGMDMALLAGLVAGAGLPVTPSALGRAEAAARPVVSRFIADGVSGESRSTLVVYVEAMLAALGGTAAERLGLAPRIAAAVKRFPTTRVWSIVLPGVPEALGRLRAAGLRLAVVSNSDGTVEASLGALGLRPLVDAVIDSTRVGFEKPDPRIFAAGLAAVGCPPARACHVGDLPAVDVTGARRAGVRPVLLDPHGDWPDADCPRFTDLAAFATALVGARA